MAAKKKTTTFLATNASDAGGRSKTVAKKTTSAAKPKITAEQFAINQLKKAGIKPTATGDVKAQFRKINKSAAQKRRKAGLGKASSVGASSALAAGSRTANPKVQAKRANVAKAKRLY